MADSRRRQPRHGERQRRRKVSVALRTFRQGRLCHRHGDRGRENHSRRNGAAWPHDLAAARPLLSRTHGSDAVRRFIILAMALAALLSACKRETKHYALKGQVVQRNPATSEITVKHDAIPGFMA